MGKHKCLCLLLKKLQTWRPAKRLQHRCFPVNIANILRTTLLQSTSGGCFCKVMKFYKDNCWLFSLRLTSCASKKQYKYLRSIKMYFCGYLLINFFIPVRRAETITWENFFPAKRDAGSTKDGSGLAGMKLFTSNHRCNLWRV